MKKTVLTLIAATICISPLLCLGEAVAPVDKNGRKMNLGFEEGSIRDWTTEGDAFEKQPIRGDAVAQRKGPGGTSGHHGEFWIGGYEAVGDNATGTLASVPFKVTQPWGAFLVAGGGWPTTRVELVDADSKK